MADFKVAHSPVKHDPCVSYDSLARFVVVRAPAGGKGGEEAARGV